jgi:hypothetical protein
MSFAEIEAALPELSADELREGDTTNECSEDDPQLLAALDEAIAKADAAHGHGHTANQVRARLNKWTSR